MVILFFQLLLLGIENLFWPYQPISLFNQGEPTLVVGNFEFYSSHIHGITLKPDKTFLFRSMPHISCVTWGHYEGTWKRAGDTLIFSDNYQIEESELRTTYQKNESHYFRIGFRTDRQSKLNNKIIALEYIYAEDAHLDDLERTFTMDANNHITIPFQSIPHVDQLSAIRVEYQLTPNETRFDYLTKNNPLNTRKQAVPNIIDVQFLEHPKKELVYRTIKGVISSDTLHIVAISKTKTFLKDYTTKLEFESYYPLKK